jgi:hypothetical protein
MGGEFHYSHVGLVRVDLWRDGFQRLCDPSHGEPRGLLTAQALPVHGERESGVYPKGAETAEDVQERPNDAEVAIGGTGREGDRLTMVTILLETPCDLHSGNLVSRNGRGVANSSFPVVDKDNFRGQNHIDRAAGELFDDLKLIGSLPTDLFFLGPLAPAVSRVQADDKPINQ